MFGTSSYLTMLKDALLNHALLGEPITANVTVEICRLLALCAANSEAMERRLSGNVTPHDFGGPDYRNVIALLNGNKPREGAQ